MADRITIQQKDAFYAILKDVEAANTALRTKLTTDGQAVTNAVTTAAGSAEVVSGTAPAYVPVITALNTTVESINAQAKKASEAVDTEITNLRTLIDGFIIIEDAGAIDVNNK